VCEWQILCEIVISNVYTRSNLVSVMRWSAMGRFTANFLRGRRVTRDGFTDPKVQHGRLLAVSRLDALPEFLVLLNFARK
jgi:hypothetical protein